MLGGGEGRVLSMWFSLAGVGSRLVDQFVLVGVRFEQWAPFVILLRTCIGIPIYDRQTEQVYIL